MRKTAIIIGSSGLTGSFLLTELLSSDVYDKVISFVRTKSEIKHPKLKEYVIDFDDIESYQDFIEGNDLFCCLGTTIKKAGSQEAFKKVDLTYPLAFAKVAATKGVKQFLFISSVGANAKSSNFYLRTKGECEENLRTMPFQSMSILRPSLLLGNRAEFRVGEKVAEFFMRIISTIFIGKLKKYKPIKSTSVAKAMFKIAQTNTFGFKTYESDKITDL